MKFGRLIYKYTGKTYEDGKGIYNIGDNIQTFAIDNFYEKMQIPKEDIIDINFSEMANYDGEYVILPLAGYASHYKRFNQLPPSDKIIPFFISFEMSDKNCDDIIPYLKKNEPIGCRDEATMKLLREKGVESYTSGCLTLSLERRERNISAKKVFFIDTPNELEKYIPRDILENCEYVSHEGEFGHYPLTSEDLKKVDSIAIDVLERYKNEARLIVTSRLHAAVPCIAMGIPVIITINNIDRRFSWLDKLVPIYDRYDYENIDWNPGSVDVEVIKSKMFQIFKEGILSLKDKKQNIYDLSAFWEDRNPVEYDRILKRKLDFLIKSCENNESVNYIIWGAGVHGRRAYELVSELAPKANFVGIIDKYVEGDFFGIDIKKPKDIFDIDFNYAIITTHLGRFEATESLKNKGMNFNENYCYFISKDVPEDNLGGLL